MASELVRVVWCDVHGKTCQATHPDTPITIGRYKRQMDMCDVVWEQLVAPLIETLEAHGRNVTEAFEEPEPNRTKNSPQFYCNACERRRGFVRKANYDKHMESEHGLRNGRQAAPEAQDDGTIVCAVCPDHEPFHSKAGFAGHVRSKAHKDNLALTA